MKRSLNVLFATDEDFRRYGDKLNRQPISDNLKSSSSHSVLYIFYIYLLIAVIRLRKH